MGETYFQEFGPKMLTSPQLVGTWVKNMFRNLVPDFLTCPQLVGTWVQNMFRNLVPYFLAHTPWRIPPYEKYPRKRVLARGHMSKVLVYVCSHVAERCFDLTKVHFHNYPQ